MALKTKIRPLLASDKLSLMELLRATTEFSSADLAVAEEVLDCYLKDSTGSGYHIFVLDRDSQISGYICYGPTPITEGTWDIYWIAVAQEARGQGLGKRLLGFAGEEIVKARGRLILIETSSKPEYQRTRGFYLSQGYEVISRIPDFYAPGDDRLILWKRLR